MLVIFWTPQLLYILLSDVSTLLQLTSNGNDIETKRNDASIIGVFSVPKWNEPSYSKTWTDRSETNTIINILCRIEEITNISSPEFAGSKKTRI
jgi:hypothetical protein